MLDRNEFVMMIDTETTNDMDSPLVYDVGYQIFSLARGVVVSRSFVNVDIFTDKELMESAYFKDKIPQYLDEIHEGKRTPCELWGIKKYIQNDCLAYHVKKVCAHNAAFDNRALNTTQRYETTSKYRYLLPYGLEWWCTLKMARQILKNDDAYGAFCYEHDYLTKNGCRRYTAEIIYRFLVGDTNFTESHTGLEDVMIERKIFEYCLSKNPEIDGRLWPPKEEPQVARAKFT